MPETGSILLLTSGPLLWMLGGAVWKPWRRFVWPAVVGAVLAATGHPWAPVALVAASLAAVNHLGYGDRTPWWGRALVFASYGLPSGWLLWWGPLVLAPLLAALLLLLMWASRRVNAVQWKIWEAAAGLLQAASIIVVS